MSNNRNVFASALALILIFALFAAALLGLNIFAAPMIEKNDSAELLAPLFKVMPGAAGFEPVYSKADGSGSLSGVPDSVVSIYAETGGLGYAMTLSTSEGYTKQEMIITMAVDAGGKICGIAVNAYPDSKNFGDDYPGTYIGADSALGGVRLVSGVTYSSKAFRDAVSDGFEALISNGLVGAGEKSDEQILLELLPSVYPGIANSEGIAQYSVPEDPGEFEYIKSVMAAANGGGAAYIAADGDVSYLALCNAAGSIAVYDTEGNPAGDSVPEALLNEVAEDAAGRLTSFEEKDISMLSKMAPEGAEITSIPVEGFSSVTGAYIVKSEEESLYGFVSRPYGYSNMPMMFAYLLDENGAVVSMRAKEFILESDYYSDFTLDKDAYTESFSGVTAETWSADRALISGATVTSNAVKTAVGDVFEAFSALMTEGRG